MEWSSTHIRLFPVVGAAIVGLTLGAMEAAGAADLVPMWVDLSRPEMGARMGLVYPDPFRKDVVWVGGRDGIYYSDDAGDTWIRSLLLFRGEGLADDDLDADSATDEGTGPGPETDLESLIEEIREELIEELASEFDIDRDDVEIDLVDELAFRLEERTDALLSTRAALAPDAPAAVRFSISAIASGVSDPEVLYAAGSGGFWRTVDDGRSWERLVTPEGTRASDVAVDPWDSDHVLLATNHGLLESEDGGVAWEDIGIPELTGRPVIGVEWSLGDLDRIAAITPRHITISTDAGRSWITRDVGIAIGALPLRAFAFAGRPDGSFYVAAGDGVWRSDDDGETWAAAAPLPETPVHLSSAAASEWVWVAGRTHVWRSSDGGDHWNAITSGWPTARVRSVAAAPRSGRDGEAWAISSIGVFRYHKVSLEALTDKALRLLAERFADEPSLGDTVGAAIRHGGLGRERLVAMRTRMRTGALLPRLALIANYRIERDESIDGLAPTSVGIDTDRDWRLYAIAAWRLPVAVSLSSASGALGLAPTLAYARDDLVDRVVATFGQRRAIALEIMRIPAGETMHRIDADLKFMELTAELDALTGGWFSRNIEKERR